MKIEILSSPYAKELQLAVNKFCKVKEVENVMMNVLGVDLIATIYYKG